MLKPLLFNALLLAPALLCAQTPASPAAPAAPAAPLEHAHASDGGATSGLKKELIEGLTEADFLRLGDKPKTVKVTLIAVFTDANYGMNFNGYAKGQAVCSIPKDWTVDVTYINPSPIPHSAIVIEKEATAKIQMPAPYFKGAAIKNHLTGLSYGKETFTFTADEAGDYAFACGFPAHAANGHWIALEISDKITEPTIKLGDGAAKPASPAKPAK